MILKHPITAANRAMKHSKTPYRDLRVSHEPEGVRNIQPNL